jgi:hypothetical protein
VATDEQRRILEQLATGDPRPHLTHPNPTIRRLAVAACIRLGPGAMSELAALAGSDPDEDVRAEAVEVLGGMGTAAFTAVWECRDDSSGRVVEAVATALGEITNTAAVPWLIETVDTHTATQVREAAVAALGAIGDGRALPTLLEAVQTGKPQIRRRAVVALTAFDGPEVETALTAARLDRNPMVREVAEMLLGRAAPEAADGDGATSDQSPHPALTQASTGTHTATRRVRPHRPYGAPPPPGEASTAAAPAEGGPTRCDAS